ncbi:toll/interleukin-1 receptor domain-containing protein, partial [Frankia sp. Mgl5]|uniref:toll/interleukin-1 receptor domain-containing protein n=1 Tax=Frankia sp. Mgl5 TaxID=2933793 RepID=UPI00200C6C6C
MAASRLFVSHSAADRAWAEWITWQLCAAGYDATFAPWDFVAGDNTVARTNAALATVDRLLALCSPAYLESWPCQEEWQALWRRSRDRAGGRGPVLPVLIGPCELPPLLAAVRPVDLTGYRGEADARARLLDGVAGRARPARAPLFPAARRPPRYRPPPAPGGPPPPAETPAH